MRPLFKGMASAAAVVLAAGAGLWVFSSAAHVVGDDTVPIADGREIERLAGISKLDLAAGDAVRHPCAAGAQLDVAHRGGSKGIHHE